MPFLTIGSALRQGSDLLQSAAIWAPRLNAEVLLCHALGCERPYLFAHPEQPLTELAWIHYGRYLHERMAGKPTQYITRRQEFYGRLFHVDRRVLIPRPETEHLIEAVLPLKAQDVIDVGCGSGAIAVTLALEKTARVLAADLSWDALEVARRNASTLGAPVGFLASDLLTAIADGAADLVVSNPPYIRTGAELPREVRDWEPHGALYAGPDGLDIYRRLFAESGRVLRAAGFLAVELGFDSLPGVSALARSGWREPRVHHDLAGIPRVLVCQKAA